MSEHEYVWIWMWMASKYFISSISISLETAYESAICLEQICLEVSRSQDEKILAYHASLLLWPVPNACASRDTPTGLTREDGVRMSCGRRSKLPSCRLRTWLIVRFQQLALLGQLSLTVIKWPYGNRGTTASKNHWKIIWFICLYYDIMRYSIFRIPTFSSFFYLQKSIRPSSFELHRPPVPAAAFVGLPPSKYMRMLQNHMSCWKSHPFSVVFRLFSMPLFGKKNPRLQSWFGFGKLGQRVVFVLIL